MHATMPASSTAPSPTPSAMQLGYELHESVFDVEIEVLAIIAL